MHNGSVNRFGDLLPLGSALIIYAELCRGCVILRLKKHTNILVTALQVTAANFVVPKKKNILPIKERSSLDESVP